MSNTPAISPFLTTDSTAVTLETTRPINQQSKPKHPARCRGDSPNPNTSLATPKAPTARALSDKTSNYRQIGQHNTQLRAPGVASQVLAPTSAHPRITPWRFAPIALRTNPTRWADTNCSTLRRTYSRRPQRRCSPQHARPITRLTNMMPQIPTFFRFTTRSPAS